MARASVFEVYQREGPRFGHGVAWIFGRNLRGFPAPACVFAGEEDAERDSRVTSAVVVSSALAACERPPAPVWLHDDASRVVGGGLASALETAARARPGTAPPSRRALVHRDAPRDTLRGILRGGRRRVVIRSRVPTLARWDDVSIRIRRTGGGTRTRRGRRRVRLARARAGTRDARLRTGGRIDASEAHRAATTIRILDDTSDEARGDADADSIADSIDADSIAARRPSPTTRRPSSTTRSRS